MSTSKVRLLHIGDSITEGQGASTKAQRWQDILRDSLRTTYPQGNTGGEGFVSSAYFSTSFPQRVTFTSASAGSYTAATSRFGPGIRYMSLPLNATATITFTGTSLDVTYARGSSSGSFTYTVDGGAASSAVTMGLTQPVGTIPNLDGNRVNIPCGAAGSHTVVITVTVASLFLTGFYAYNGDENNGLRVWDAGHFGFRSIDLLDTINYENYSMIQPDLVTMGFGTNEWGSASVSTRISPNQQYAAMVRIANEIKARCMNAPSFLFFLPYKRGNVTTANPYPWTDYLAAITAAAATVNAATLDLGPVIGDLGVSNSAGLGNADLIHPSDTGHAAIAAALQTALTA